MISRGPLGSRDLTDDQVDAFLASPGGLPLASMTRYTAVGTPDEVRAYLEDLAAATHADELILAHHAQNLDDRVRSIELTGAAMAEPAPIP